MSQFQFALLVLAIAYLTIGLFLVALLFHKRSELCAIKPNGKSDFIEIAPVLLVAWLTLLIIGFVHVRKTVAGVKSAKKITATSDGYWITDNRGMVSPFGDAGFQKMSALPPCRSVEANPSYRVLVGADGKIYASAELGWTYDRVSREVDNVTTYPDKTLPIISASLAVNDDGKPIGLLAMNAAGEVFTAGEVIWQGDLAVDPTIHGLNREQIIRLFAYSRTMDVVVANLPGHWGQNLDDTVSSGNVLVNS